MRLSELHRAIMNFQRGILKLGFRGSEIDFAAERQKFQEELRSLKNGPALVELIEWDEEKHTIRCPKCKHECKPEELEPQPDPCSSEIHGDDTPVVQCNACREASLDEI